MKPTNSRFFITKQSFDLFFGLHKDDLPNYMACESAGLNV